MNILERYESQMYQEEQREFAANRAAEKTKLDLEYEIFALEYKEWVLEKENKTK